MNEHPELEAEQRRLDQAYAYLDQARRAAAAVLEQLQDVGSNQQALYERDVSVAHAQQRLAQLSFGDAQLCFGRLDELDGRHLYVGRVAVTAPDQEPFVIDWRAPASAPFYRATAIDPMGVVRRRHFHARGRALVGIDDEVFDTEASERAGLHLVGEAALLAALARARTGRMGDIVGTIQAEQDEAIRAPLPGILTVQGGPGTGKTAVALHRAAYLLYTHRQALAGTGVLVVGPNRLFLRYISNVLPSLGEEGVVLSTPWGLASTGRPGRVMAVRRVEDPRVAALKGDARMATVLTRALDDRERPLPRDLVLRWRGHPLRLSVADSDRIVRRVQRMRGSHNERRSAVAQRVVDHLMAQHREAAVREARLGRLGGPSPEEAGDADGANVVSLADFRRGRDSMVGLVPGGAAGHGGRRGARLVPRGVRPRRAADRGGPRGPVPHVARPRTGGAAPRPVRLPAAPGAGGQGDPHRRRAGAPAPVPRRVVGGRPVVRGRHRPARRAVGTDRSPARRPSSCCATSAVASRSPTSTTRPATSPASSGT